MSAGSEGEETRRLFERLKELAAVDDRQRLLMEMSHDAFIAYALRVLPHEESILRQHYNDQLAAPRINRPPCDLQCLVE
jgi:hypothetical protein